MVVAPGGTLKIQSVGICLKPGQPQAGKTIQELVKWLGDRGIEPRVDAECASVVDLPGEDIAELAASADLLVSLGGDGTLWPWRAPRGVGGYPSWA